MTHTSSKKEELLKYAVSRFVDGTDVIDNELDWCAFMEVVNERITQALKELKEEVIGSGELHYSHVCPPDSKNCIEYHAREALRHKQRKAIDNKIRELEGK